MRTLLPVGLALVASACDSTPDPGPVLADLVVDVRPATDAPVPDDLRLALVWSTSAGALGAPGFVATEGAAIATGLQQLALHDEVPVDALAWSERDMTRVARASLVAFEDGDGDDVLTPTALDADALADRVVGWSLRGGAVYYEADSAADPDAHAGFGVLHLDDSGFPDVGGTDTTVRVDLLAAEAAACYGLALPPRLDDDALATELEARAPRDEGRLAAVEIPFRPGPGGEVPATWSEVYCRQDAGYQYYVELIAQPVAEPALCGPAVEYCTIFRDTPMPGAWCGGAP